MAGFVRRFTSLPTIATLLAIESVNIIDLTPAAPITGAGTGVVLMLGEFEDGLFATDPESKGALEVFGTEDYRQKFGGFGFTYAGVPSCNPCARRHHGEFWNGNGWLKGYKLKAQRLLISRVDTSVGAVSFDPLASIEGGAGPFIVAVGASLSFTTNTGTGATTAVTGVVATVAGASQAFSTLLSGETVGFKIDGGPQINVVFSASDTTQAAVIARVNGTLGYACAVAATTQVNFRGLQVGSGGSIELVTVTPGVLAKLGHTAGTTAGTGTFANLNSVTAVEVAAYVNGASAVTTVNGAAAISPTGSIRLINSSPSAASTVLVAAGSFATALGLATIGTAVAVTSHLGGTIPAGTRVRTSGGAEWVTMQTLDIDAGEVGPYDVKVRPALDDGTALTTAAGTVTVLVDPPSFAPLVVNNAAALTAALTEAQLDVAYATAMNATLDESGDAYLANYLLCARRSGNVIIAGRANVLRATECGLHARKFITGDPIGTTVAQSIANVALYRSDRVFYTCKAWKVTIPEIAARGTAGGIGFTADGVISVRPDGPLTTLCAMLAPEENPGQQTHLIDDFFAVDNGGEVMTVETYTALKAAGICAPRVDRVSGSIYQSGVTSSLESGREEMLRRKFADFLQDTAADLGRPFSKKLQSQIRRDQLTATSNQFLGDLQSEGNPAASRLESFNVDDGVNVGNTQTTLGKGIFYLKWTVRQYSSMNAIVFITEIGPNVVVSREVIQ